MTFETSRALKIIYEFFPHPQMFVSDQVRGQESRSNKVYWQILSDFGILENF